jgi:hypothetical protein
MKLIKKKNEQNTLNHKIKAVVDMMFDDIPYSEEITQAQEKIETALNAEFDRIKADRHEDEALEELLGKYGRLSQMAELAGYPAQLNPLPSLEMCLLYQQIYLSHHFRYANT